MWHDIVRFLIGCLPATTWNRPRCRAVLLMGVSVLAADLNAQTRQGQAPEDKTSSSLIQPDQRVSLAGCAASALNPTKITFFDKHHSLLYRLTDRGMRFSRSRRLNIVGGLVPTTNIAAQPDDAVTYSIAWQQPSPIGFTPFTAPKKRTMWIGSFGSPCDKP